jgi:hypothetical protein
MTPVPWAACCKQRRYGDGSPASYTSIRSTTFAESLPGASVPQAPTAKSAHFGTTDAAVRSPSVATTGSWDPGNIFPQNRPPN